MKVWSKTLTVSELWECAREVNLEHPGCTLGLQPGASIHQGPRVRRIDDVHLRSANGRYFPNSGTRGAAPDFSGMAASWAEWGWFLLRVFARDPEARCGDYHGLEDFHVKTKSIFEDPRTPRELQLLRVRREAVVA